MSDIDQRIAVLSPAKRELLRQIAARQRSGQNRIQPRPRPDRIPVTFGQRRLWLLDQFSPGLNTYNVPVGLWLEGTPDAGHLQAALQCLVDRHESLRTVFRSIQGEPSQFILDRVGLPWSQHVVSGATPTARRTAALSLARDEARRPFDLARDAMLRASLIDAGAGETGAPLHVLLLTFHHIAMDGWGASVLLGELQSLYNALQSGTPEQSLHTVLPAPGLQVADVALWQQDTFGGENLQPQLDHWLQHLEGAPATLDLPCDRARPAVQGFNGAIWRTYVPEALYQRLETVARERNATLSMVFLAAYQALLARYTGQDDVVVAMGVAGRARIELEQVAGFFVNTLAMRARIDGDASFAALLDQVRRDMLDAMDNADAPLDRVLEGLRLPRSASHTPLAQAMYFFQNYPGHETRLTGLQSQFLDLVELAPGTTPADISFAVNQQAPREVKFTYSTDLFDETTIERFGGHLLTLLEAVAADADARVATLPLLTRAEREELASWNDATQRELPQERTLSEFIAAQVARTPDAVALEFAGRQLSYRELDQRANALAHELRDAGVSAGALVGLYVERSVEMVVGLLAILKAGGGYVPLDPAYPADRLAYMLEMSEARVLVTQRELADALPESFRAAGVSRVVLADANAVLGDTAHATPDGGARADDLAYVIFTSGSTGKPKGVEIQHQAAVNLLRSVARQPGVAAGDTVCAISTLSFDIALFELVLPLTVGARIALVDRDTARDGLRLRRLVDASRFTVMQATPATWRMLLEVGWRGTPGLRRIISTGEALPRELADRLLPCANEVWNLYGPTETTVYSALCQVHAGEGPILVGKPVDNTQIHIVDRHMQLMPIGVPGELLIGGTGLARGYCGRPDLTEEKFISDPFSSQPGARLYRTGDLALWRRDGTIEVIGRIDHQVKLRGFRIELGEIESVLALYPGVTQAVVHCREDRPGDKRLVAYVTADGSAPTTTAPTAAALRDHLKAALPDYMVPSAFVVLERFPLTPNGKVDRRALPVPETSAGNDRESIAPRTPEEVTLAQLWQQLLGTTTVDVRDNFFDAGGHSLLATQLLARIDQAFAVELPLRALFEAPTLEQLAARIAVEREQLHLEGDDLDALLASLEGLSDEEASDRLLADTARTGNDR
ncbi:non-ribosomal peptide synthetase [Lysobacter fragariae]